MPQRLRPFLLLVIIALASTGAIAQGTAAALGSETAKNGFKNEDEIRDKFIAWKDRRRRSCVALDDGLQSSRYRQRLGGQTQRSKIGCRCHGRDKDRQAHRGHL